MIYDRDYRSTDRTDNHTQDLRNEEHISYFTGMSKVSYATSSWIYFGGEKSSTAKVTKKRRRINRFSYKLNENNKFAKRYHE